MLSKRVMRLFGVVFALYWTYSLVCANDLQANDKNVKPITKRSTDVETQTILSPDSYFSTPNIPETNSAKAIQEDSSTTLSSAASTYTSDTGKTTLSISQIFGVRATIETQTTQPITLVQSIFTKKFEGPPLSDCKKPNLYSKIPKKLAKLVQPDSNVEDVDYVEHSFYKSALIKNDSYFNEYWTNITNGSLRVLIHPRLNNIVYRRDYHDTAYTMRLPFAFPYYGHYLKNVTISSGGYLFTGCPGHRFLAQDQCISPLMAKWDLSLNENSSIVSYQQAQKITYVWENVAVREKPNEKFTFGVTLHKNGNIYFIYKDVPIEIQKIDEKTRSVFVGIADSYHLNKVTYYVKRNVAHNYSRVPFYTYNIESGCILQLLVLPSCPTYTNCEDCVAHAKKYDTFHCSWCQSLHRCTSGADYFRPYLADCPFTKVCNGTEDTNDSFPEGVEFIKRDLN